MLLSVIIPSYNHRAFVLKTIRAASLIDIPQKEILIIDDGSRDGSAQLIRDYIASGAAGDGARLIERENRGLVKTLNEGLGLAQGKYLYGVASDDIPIPDGIKRLVAAMEATESLQFVMGNVLYMESEDQGRFQPAYGRAHARFVSLSPEKRDEEMFLNYPQPMLLQGTLFRRSGLNAIGGWRDDIILDDMSLFIRLLSEYRVLNRDFAFRPEIMACFYRRHETNVSRNVERQFFMVEQVIDNLCPPRWKDLAYLKNLAGHATIALHQKNASAVGRLLRSTMPRVNALRLALTTARDGPRIFKSRRATAQLSIPAASVEYRSASEVLRSTILRTAAHGT